MAAKGLASSDDDMGDGIVAEINITPLTDIFLVLLIIFMVTTSVISNQGKEVDLPSSALSDATPSGVTVTVTPDGGIQVDGVDVSAAQLPSVLKAKLKVAREKVVVLRGDRKVMLGAAVNILDVAQAAGAQSFALSTKPPAPGEL